MHIKVQDADDLRQSLTDVGPECNKAVMTMPIHWRRRFHACIQARGKHLNTHYDSRNSKGSATYA